MSAPRAIRPFRSLVGALALFLAAACAVLLGRTTEGLIVETFAIGPAPVTLHRAPDAAGPLVVIAHGFAGSRPLMQPFAVTLARNGYRAATFDFPGHGRNEAPLTGSLTELDGATETLLASLRSVADGVRDRLALTGPYAVLGHSMASDIVVRHGQQDPAVRAVIAVSLFSPAVEADSPRNLLILNGALEGQLNEAGLEALRLAAGPDAVEGHTYGSFADGTARRFVRADGVEHVGVLFSPESMEAAVRWLDQAFGRDRAPSYVDDRGAALVGLILALLTLAWAAAPLLPRVADQPFGAGLHGRRLTVTLLLPALATPLLLRLVPIDFLPVLVGDYLAVHFGTFGVIASLLAHRALRPPAGQRWGRLAGAVLGYLAFGIVLGAVLNWQLVSFVPTTERLPLLAAVVAGLLPFFLADEWLTRGPTARWYGYAVAKLAFLLSLALAVALDFERLFFLLIIVPLIVPFFLVFGLASAWSYRATGHPWVAAIGNALIFAWAIAVTFPFADG